MNIGTRTFTEGSLILIMNLPNAEFFLLYLGDRKSV